MRSYPESASSVQPPACTNANVHTITKLILVRRDSLVAQDGRKRPNGALRTEAVAAIITTTDQNKQSVAKQMPSQCGFHGGPPPPPPSLPSPSASLPSLPSLMAGRPSFSGSM